MRALEAALNTIWAMEEGALQTLLTIAAREHEVTPEALEAYEAKSLARAERARARDGVAIIDMHGALTKRANIMTAMSGATSYEIVRKDFQAALDDPKIKSILLNIDSPGGEASGTAELAAAIYAARGIKPITAYASGMACSAGYWIAAAADRIVVDPTALLGSIGVKWAIQGDPPENDKRAKTYTFISSQSPLKNADPATEAGAAHLQSAVDAMGQVFVESIAAYRGVDTETVLNNFGKGGIFVGKDAVKAGLADEVGDFESVLSELSASKRKGSSKIGSNSNKGTSMSETEHDKPAASASAEDIAKAVAEAVSGAQAAERTRLTGLSKIAKAHGVDGAVLDAAIAEGTDIAAFAIQVADLTAKASADKAASALEALKTDEKDASKAEASNGKEPGEETVASVAAAIIAA